MKKRLMTLLACLVLVVCTAFAQRTVKGTVISQEDGQPVIGATIKIVGSKTGTTTDIDGHFSISVPDGKKLQVSYVGMISQTVTVKDGMTVTLKPDDKVLSEVVVTGMQKMDRRMFTGATDKVNASDAIINGIADVSRSLEGRSAGVSVQNVSGTFGTAPKIRVRGATSIYGSSKPLWVVDGVIMEDVTDINSDDLSSGDPETLISSAIAGLNSDDIESFQILKDGSATSIYGARAMAGVIVVTTKKGKAGQAHINYTGEFTTRLIPSYGDFNILNSQDQMGIYRELQDKGWLSYSNVLNGSDYGVYGKMYELINTYNPATGTFELANTLEARNQYLQNAELRNTNWFDELFSTDIMMNHSISLSGGTAKSNYYASMSIMTDPGWYKQSNVDRYTLNMNMSHHIFDNLTLNLIGSGSYRKQKAPGTLSQDLDVVNGNVKRDFDINPYSYALNTSRALDPDTYYQSNYAPFNIMHELETNYIDINFVDTKFQAELKWNPIKDLELSGLAAMKYTATSQEYKILDGSNQAEAYRAMDNAIIRDGNKYLYTDIDDPFALPVTVLPNGGFLRRTDNRMVDWNFRLTANYNHVFNKVHALNVFGGMETTSIDRNRTWFNGVGMQYSKGEIPFYTYTFFKKAMEENTDYYTLSNTNSRSAAFFANFTYGFDNKYILTGTYRYEGSNAMGKSRSARWTPTWNVAASWNVDEENFFKSLRPALSHLKLKMSYSLTATPPPTGYTSSTNIFKAFQPYRVFSQDKETGIQITDLANDNLTYEKKNEFNFGFEAGFLNDRINVAFDIYTRKNFDEIGPVATQGIGGQIIRWANAGDMKSSGEELSISTTNIKAKDFSWNTSFVFSHTKTKITNLASQDRAIDLLTNYGGRREGYPVRALFSVPFQGLSEEGLPTFINEAGEVTVYDVNLQERDKLDYLKYEGPTDPTIQGSLGNLFKYKGFSLNLFITYSFGNVVRLDPVFRGVYSDLSSMTKEFKNRWMVSGDEKITNVPAILSYGQYSNDRELSRAYNVYNYSDVRIAKGDFIRMKEISLAYDFPKSWIHPLTNLSLKLQATNLFLIYADKKLNGQDPEFFRSGGVSAPVPKQFTLTLKAGF
ncbi:MAG: SusC/RagA family TonB-linked outer membrane protein [Prevotella sp.]|nr:SusC/RagA family TonB-linked outer membrane protein [Prevotella sp.]